MRDMLKAHGTFSALEVHVKKTQMKKKRLERAGGWYTKTHLQNVCHWTKLLKQQF